MKITQGLPFGYCEGTICPNSAGKCENPTGRCSADTLVFENVFYRNTMPQVSYLYS